MDFSKAFDSVPHQRLLRKLHNIGIKSKTLKWIDSFLTNRLQQVVVEGEASDKCKVTSGVPQGTVLGPLLFLVYINDLPSRIRSNVRLFADDCIVYRDIKNTRDTEILQDDLDTLVKWESDWQMSFNASKCFQMRISHKRKPIQVNYRLGNTILEEVKHNPYLGVELSKDLSWATHIDQITSKANKMLGLLKRNLYLCSTRTKDIAYKSLIRPKLEYCSAIWDPHHKSDQTKLEMIQHRAARFATRNYSRDSSITEMLAELKWETLKIRRDKARLTTLYKETHGKTPSNVAHYLQNSNSKKHNYRTRQTGPLKYKVIGTNKDCYRHSLYPKTIPEWNLLDDETRNSPSVKAFKAKLDSVDIANVVAKAHFKI